MCADFARQRKKEDTTAMNVRVAQREVIGRAIAEEEAFENQLLNLHPELVEDAVQPGFHVFPTRVSRVHIQGYFAYKKSPPPLGPPYIPRDRATVGS